jgi:hypothetical protein
MSSLAGARAIEIGNDASQPEQVEVKKQKKEGKASDVCASLEDRIANSSSLELPQPVVSTSLARYTYHIAWETRLLTAKKKSIHAGTAHLSLERAIRSLSKN